MMRVVVAAAALLVVALALLQSVASLAEGAVLAGPVSTPSPAGVEVFQTSVGLAQHLTRMPDLAFSPSAGSGTVVRVDDRVRYQRFGGVGAAMTDSSAWLIGRLLTPAARTKLLDALFGADGIRLNFVRVPIGASDFTVGGRPYSYDELPAGQTDPSLTRFSIRHDMAYIIPTLRGALAINPGLRLEANPWTAPSWMKTNSALDNVGFGGSLWPWAYRPFADYFVKFLQAYANAGVPIQAITVMNEPGVPASYPGMNLNEPSEVGFIERDLRPALRATGLHPQIYGNDASWDRRSYVSWLIHDLPGIAGIAWHCYAGNPTIMNGYHRAAPQMDQILNECSPEIRAVSPTEVMIATLRNWVSTVAMWNVALDPVGGPVEPPDTGCPGCSGVVTVDPGAGRVSYGLKYYQLGQISRFVLPGAVRIRSDHFVTYGRGWRTVSRGLDDVAFLNPDRSEVVVAYNNSPIDIHFQVRWHERSFAYTIEPKETTTFVWR